MRIFMTGASGFIGTHLVERLLELHPDATLLNVDLAQPNLTSHEKFWKKVDIMDPAVLTETARAFMPTHVIHMAARTDPDGLRIEDYAINIKGSENLLAAIGAISSVRHTIFFSTQYVVRPGLLASRDDEYRPVNLYGESKCLMEQMIREDSNIPYSWTIVRPTNIWGPWHRRYPQEFWLVLKKGRYVHPGGSPVRRAYGYVGNVVEYVCKIIDADLVDVDRKTFYIGDPIDDIKVWVGAFSEAIIRRNPRIVPRGVLRIIALFGDAVRFTGGTFPLFTSRYKSMTQEYIVDMQPTFRALGPPRYQLLDGVRITVDWLKTQGSPWTN